MLIDWFTVGAQALNFIILVWLLKRFLYRPILEAVDAREKRIAAQLADADSRRAEALEERDEFRRKNEDFDRQRAALLAEAADGAKAEGERLREAARLAAEAEAAKRRAEVLSEAAGLRKTVAQRARTEVFAATRKALSDLAGAGLEERMIEVFSGRLRGLDASTRERLGAALGTAASGVLVRSAFELPPAQRAALLQTLNEVFHFDVPVLFETIPDLIAGIELSANGRKLAWTFADYLGSLDLAVTGLAEGGGPPETPRLTGALGLADTLRPAEAGGQVNP